MTIFGVEGAISTREGWWFLKEQVPVCPVKWARGAMPATRREIDVGSPGMSRGNGAVEDVEKRTRRQRERRAMGMERRSVRWSGDQ